MCIATVFDSFDLIPWRSREIRVVWFCRSWNWSSFTFVKKQTSLPAGISLELKGPLIPWRPSSHWESVLCLLFKSVRGGYHARKVLVGASWLDNSMSAREEKWHQCNLYIVWPLATSCVKVGTGRLPGFSRALNLVWLGHLWLNLSSISLHPFSTRREKDTFAFLLIELLLSPHFVSVFLSGSTVPHYLSLPLWEYCVIHPVSGGSLFFGI